ncbi:hypothetical protein CPB84DRAFT_1766254 [Gymnopilus junonius]|uniref:F-box domain-containing protein n=1 Tax=Gymnopilus junonius TaxID=109634 RepID=A0A9P5NXL7_GYMJU|nr:hypothetical protein CPB84DRAFT_1766254 [Gymnopilus junonius]
MSTSTYPARIPASVFTNPRRRRSSVKSYTALPTLKAQVRNSSTTDDVYVPRSPTFMSIAYLRDAIAAIDLKMTALIKERADLEIKLETAVRLESPLLSNIFRIGVLGMGDEDPIMVATLMLVCRYWADVALNTPLLWAKISVSPHNSLEKARRRLVRSKSCPLDITINYGPRMEYTQSVTEHIIHAMDLFRPVLWRTKSFNLTVPNRPHAHTALLRCQEDAPILESLTIQVYHSMQDDHYSSTLLRTCSLTSFNFGWDLKLIKGLTVLKLGGYFNSSTPSATTLLDMLRQCPELEEFTLRNIIDDFDTPIVNKIHLPRLKKMTFYYSALYAQALTRLPLKYLRIETCLFNEMKFVSLLRKLPSLVTLQLVDIEDVSHHSIKVCVILMPTWVCPRLEFVTLDGCTSIDWDSLRALVESRLPADPHAYKRYHPSTASTGVSSASAAAADYARMKSRQDRSGHAALLAAPQRIQMIDVTRCNQISKEMLQWLRMYVPSVRYESTKGVWGEPTII